MIFSFVHLNVTFSIAYCNIQCLKCYYFFHCTQPCYVLIQVRAFNHYLLETVTADNVETLQILYKINLLLSQSIKVLGFNQSGHLYFSTETTLARYFAQLYEPSTMHPDRGVLPQNVLVHIQVHLQNQTPFKNCLSITEHNTSATPSSAAGRKAVEKGNPIHTEIQRIYISK